jgi:serine/threonine protein kinase
MYDGGKYVLKHIKNIAAVDRFVRTEFNALKDLIHPNLPRLYDVRPPSDDYHLRLEYIPGAQLADCIDTFRGRPDQILQLATPLLHALEALEEHGIAHRDISPKNIIVPDEGGRTCLIDFGLAKLREDSRTSAVGTPLYRDPNVEREGWSKTSDLYSISVVLFEAFTGELPFAMENGSPRKSILRTFAPADEAAYGPSLLKCLRRGAGLLGERYLDAKSFLSALNEAITSPEPQQTGSEIHLAWVRQIRGLYRNSASGNPDNRGLDSDFARATYVPTRLDTALLPDIAALKKNLVLLTGNPGDGKTAFLEKVRDELKARGAQVDREDRYGWELHYAGKHFEAIFDASESRGPRTDAEVLKLALTPFAGNSAPDPASLPTLLIAINDGRLHKFLNSERASFTWLADSIGRLIFEDAPADDYVEIVVTCPTFLYQS